MELKDIQKAVQDEVAPLTKSVEEIKGSTAKIVALEDKVKEIETKSNSEDIKKDAEDLKSKVKKLENDATENQKVIDEVVASKNKKSFGEQPTESFNDMLAKAFEKYGNQIKNFRKGDPMLTMDLMPEFKEVNKEGIREVKAVGDMSITANFPGSTNWTVDRRTGIIETPYNRVWLADVLPQGTSNGSSVIYPKENGGEGGAALWTDYTTDKPQMDFDLTTQTAYFKWIAGWVIIDREMLDDISFLLSYLQNKMLISLKIAENLFVLNGSAGTNPVTGMLAAATPYNGAYVKLVDQIIDAGWGQIVEDTFDFYNPTNVILTPRDSVSVGLNKATGSGEYDLPNGSVAFTNGQLQVGGIDVVRTTQIGTGNFLVFDKRATMFIRRMQPELRMFEDAVLAKKNKIMFRVEERATLLIFNNEALVLKSAS